MSKRAIRLLVALVTAAAGISVAARADAVDVWQTRATGLGLTAIDFVDAQRGWVGGPGGVVFATSDGGSTWTPHPTGVTRTIRDIEFVDPSHGWAVGDRGMVMATSDGGNTWTSQYTGQYQNRFTSVAFASATSGLVADDRGDVYSTSDGGQSWSHRRRVGEQFCCTFSDVDMIDAQHAWIAGTTDSGDARVAFTLDAGRTWNLRPIHTSCSGCPVDAQVDFVDGQYGWATAFGSISSSQDGGQSWTWRQTLGPDVDGLEFVDRSRGWVLQGDTVKRTTDGAVSWTASTLPFTGARLARAGTSPVVVGGREVATSPDGGVTWTRHAVDNALPLALRSIDFADAQNGWIVGDAGTIRRTSNGGTSWQNQASGTTRPLRAVDFVDALHGAAVGGVTFGDTHDDATEGVILTTSDGGASWQRRTSGVPAGRYESVSFTDALHGWATGKTPGFSVLLKTVDGGATWTRVIPADIALSEVQFVNALTGWVSGGNQVWKTINGGTSWTQQSLPGAGTIEDIFFLDAQRGWYSSGGRQFPDPVQVGRTTNGGDSWQAVVPSEALLALRFVNPTEGRAVSATGSVFVSDDGGASWRPVTTDVAHFLQLDILRDVAPGAGTWWAVGDGGTVLSKIDRPPSVGRFVSIPPARILDTRPEEGGAGPLREGEKRMVFVADRGGIPSSGAAAVVLNVTVTGPTKGSLLTIWPAGTPRPLASNLNFAAGQTVANLVTVPVPSGYLDVANDLGDVHVIIDVAGWYVLDWDGIPPGTGGLFHPVPPARVFDSRPAEGGTGALTQQETRAVQITGRGGVPLSGVTGVVVNLTITEPTAGSLITLFPSGTSKPLVSNINFGPGQVRANLAAVKLGPDGKLNVTNDWGNTHVILDVAGWFGTGESTDGEQFHPGGPHRILDTRPAQGGSGPLGEKEVRAVQVAGTGGVPASGATAVVMNVTVTNPTAGSLLTLFPTDQNKPRVSNLNFGPGQTIPNLVTVKIGPDGKVNVTNDWGSADVIFDVAGWYG